MTNKTLYIFQISLSFTVSCLFSLSAEALGHRVELEETPLGYYEKKSLPTPRAVPYNKELKVTAVSNQGPLGTCASFTATACGECFYPQHKFSSAEFTVLAETQLTPKDSGDCRPGLFLGKALSVAQTYGFIDESRLPYSTYLSYVAKKSGLPLKSLSNVKEPEICIKDRAGGVRSYNRTMVDMGSDLRLTGTTQDIGYRFSQLYPLHHVSHHDLSLALRGYKPSAQKKSIGTPANANVDSVVDALAFNMPVAVALPVFEGCWESDTVSLPTRGHRNIGWHAVTLTGYNLRSETFTLKNSWGVNWGDNGFADIPFEYVRLYSSEMIAVSR